MKKSFIENGRFTKFDYWCQHVLPAVYDNSLTVYEVLCKLTEALNEVFENQNELLDEWKNMKEWIDTQLEIYSKEQLEKWKDDGTLDNIINDTLFNELNTKLNKVITDSSNTQSELTSFKETYRDDYVIMIGDSYGTGRAGSIDVMGWCDRLVGYWGLSTSGTNPRAYITAENTSGFTQAGQNGNTFLGLLQNLTISTENKNKITHIVVAGGYNDRNSTVSSIKGAIETFATYVNSNFPNAQVWVAMVGNDVRAATSDRAANRVGIFQSALPGYNEARAKNLHNIGGAYAIMKDPSNIADDGYHGNEQGYKRMAKHIYDGIKSTAQYISRNINMKYVVQNSDDTLNFVAKIVGDTTTINIPTQLITFTSALTPTVASYYVAYIPFLYRVPCEDLYPALQLQLAIRNAGSTPQASVLGTLHPASNLTTANLTFDDRTYTQGSITGITAIGINRCTFTVPTRSFIYNYVTYLDSES